MSAEMKWSETADVNFSNWADVSIRFLPELEALQDSGNNAGEEDEAETPERLFTNTWNLESLASSFPEMNAVIDLTNTNRYYEGNRLEDVFGASTSSCRHVKIRVEGRQLPSEAVFRRFCDEVDRILRRNSDSLIGVHCTHGVNRTGYLICRYLIQRRNWAPSEAVKAFETHRGHKIDRSNYVEALHRLHPQRRFPPAHREHRHHSYYRPPPHHYQQHHHHQHHHHQHHHDRRRSGNYGQEWNRDSYRHNYDYSRNYVNHTDSWQTYGYQNSYNNTRRRH